MSLPELPTDTTRAVATTGHSRTVHGRTLILLPYTAPIGANRGRAYRVETGYGTTVSRVVLSIAGQAALRPPDDIPLEDGQPLALTLRAAPARPTQAIPADLAAALTAARLDLAELDQSRTRHLVSMVAEARDPQIRADRVTAAVQAARRATETHS